MHAQQGYIEKKALGLIVLFFLGAVLVTTITSSLRERESERIEATAYC